jgi:RNA polymerase sigma-70 factor (ECF subfamily)
MRVTPPPAARLDPAAPPHPEAALVAQVAVGDAEAFRTLVTAHVRSITAIARGMLEDADEADDLAQEVFLRLWRNAASLQIGPAGVKPWLRRVVSNLAIDRLRATAHVVVTDTVPEVGERATQGDAMESADLAARVQAALSGLPDRQRLALVLFHFEGLSQAEVAAAMDVSDEAVESLLARGRRALKSVLVEDWRLLAPDQWD